MARITKIKTSPDTLLPKGEGWRRLMAPMTVKTQRQAAEREALAAKGTGKEESTQARVNELRLAEKHLKENRK
jgi:hypothetical protein